MPAYIEIVWDGAVQGLPDHRLSIEAFGPALGQLLAAIQRIASDLEIQATGPALQRGRRGRLAREASSLDVQIETLQTDSPVSLRCAVVSVEPPTRPLINDLPEQAIDAFVRDVEREAKGVFAHYRVRSFLKALPKGVSDQKYVFRASDGEVRRAVSIGAMAIPETKPAPHLVEVDGILVGLGFEEGRTEVKIRATSGEVVSMSATPEQVERALDLRLRSVTALAVAERTKTRLLRLATDAVPPPAAETRADYVFSTWRDLLHLLAQ